MRPAFGQPRRQSAVDTRAAIMIVVEAWAKARSKGNTKVGAAVYDPKSGGMFLGYNGFPRGIPDLESVWTAPRTVVPNKHTLVIHAEANAVMKAVAAIGSDLSRTMLVCTMLPCSRCMRDYVLNVGIREVVYKDENADMLDEEERQAIRYLADVGQVRLTRIG